MTYDDVINLIENSDIYSSAEGFECLSGHRRQASAWQVEVTWLDGSRTWEPLSIIAVDDPVSCARYAKENNLLNTQGWKPFRQLAKKDGRYIRMIQNALSEYASANAAKTTTEKEASFVEDPSSGEMVLGLSCRTDLKNVIPRIEEKLRETSGESKLARTRTRVLVI